MPELPEAETIGRALHKALAGRTIKDVQIFSPAMRTPLAPLKSAALTGRKFVSVRRRGRYLVAALDDDRGLLMHFGMSGVVRVEPASVAKRKHEHVFIHLSDGMVFRFECTRRFSMLEVHTLQSDGFPAVLADLGVEPLSEDFTGEYFLRCCSNRATPVKNLLMDNKIVTGIGNIYAAETLFASGVSPLRPGKMLTSSEASEIVKNAREILQRAIADGGTTISDFRHVDGSEGKFVQNLQIYGKDNEKCPRCGTVIQSVRLGGRASCYCPECQK